MFKFKKSFFIYFILFAMILIALNSPKILSCVRDSLALCFATVIPSLFPFMVLSSLFVNLADGNSFRITGAIAKRLLGIRPAATTAFICGLICGYPIGAKCACELYRTKKISASEAESLIAYSNNSGPLFVIGAAGVGIFGSLKAGVLLYIIQIFSALTSAMLLKRHTCYPVMRATAQKSNAKDFTDCVCMAVMNVLNVCGFIVFFAVINVLLEPVLSIMPDFVSCICSCILEITNGISKIGVQSYPIHIKLAMASFALGWSGFSVHMQVKSLIKDTGLSMKKYYITRLFIGALSAMITYFVACEFDTIAMFVCTKRAVFGIVIFLLCALVGFLAQKKEGESSLSF